MPVGQAQSALGPQATVSASKAVAMERVPNKWRQKSLQMVQSRACSLYTKTSWHTRVVSTPIPKTRPCLAGMPSRLWDLAPKMVPHTGL